MLVSIKALYFVKDKLINQTFNVMIKHLPFKFFVYSILISLVFACKNDTKSNDKTTTEVPKVSTHQTFEQVDIEPILENDSLSIRAIEVIGNNLAFAANYGTYGLYNSANQKWKLSQQSAMCICRITC